MEAVKAIAEAIKALMPLIEIVAKAIMDGAKDPLAGVLDKRLDEILPGEFELSRARAEERRRRGLPVD